jgi:hypothetical protein
MTDIKLSEEQIIKESEILVQEKTHKSLCEGFLTGIFDVEFIKADGSFRQMRCTRDAKYIPVDDNELTKVIVLKEGQVPKKPNYSALRVYELNVGWRSFKVNSYTDIQQVLPESIGL